MTSDLDRLLEPYIKGTPGQWYFDHDFGEHSIGSGLFEHKDDCRRRLKAMLREVIRNDHVLKDYLALRAAVNEDDP